jgi:hypothetical protein
MLLVSPDRSFDGKRFVRSTSPITENVGVMIGAEPATPACCFGNVSGGFQAFCICLFKEERLRKYVLRKLAPCENPKRHRRPLQLAENTASINGRGSAL